MSSLIFLPIEGFQDAATRLASLSSALATNHYALQASLTCRQCLARARASAATENFDVIFCVCQAETDIFFSTNEVPFKLDKQIQVE